MSVGTRNEVAPHDHVVQFYRADADLIRAVATYLADALRADEAAIAVVTPSHAAALDEALLADGIDTATARDRGSLVLLDARQTLDQFMDQGRPVADAFNEVIGGVIERAAGDGRRVRAFGEMVALLWDDDQVGAAIELETLWNELGRVLPFSLFCAYPVESVTASERRPDLQHVCHLHSSVVEAAEHTRSYTRAAESARAARRFVVETLEMWRLPALTQDASLIVAELATNAVIHAQTDFVVAVSARQGTVRLSVRDWCVDLPTSRRATIDEISGRGLHLIDVLADRWGTELIPGGKVVWADLCHGSERHR